MIKYVLKLNKKVINFNRYINRCHNPYIYNSSVYLYVTKLLNGRVVILMNSFYVQMDLRMA